jgi:hypothetical protein
MSESLSQQTQDCCRAVLRAVLAGRDALLFAAAADVDTATLQRFCRALADELGGQAAGLEQLLVGHGCSPITPGDAGMDRLRAVMVGPLVQPREVAPVDTPPTRPVARGAPGRSLRRKPVAR